MCRYHQTGAGTFPLPYSSATDARAFLAAAGLEYLKVINFNRGAFLITHLCVGVCGALRAILRIYNRDKLRSVERWCKVGKRGRESDRVRQRRWGWHCAGKEVKQDLG